MSISFTNRNLTLARKIALTIAGVSLPLIVAVIYFVLTGNNKDLNFARQELRGNAYQRPLENVLRGVSAHQRLTAAAIGGDAAARSQMASVQSEIATAFSALAAADATYGKALQFTPEGLAKRQRSHVRVETVQEEWTRLKGQAAGLTVEASDERHQHIISDVRTMITHAGDTSNLILDPDLDSFYVMDITLVRLPQTQERLGAIYRFGFDALADGTLTAEEKTRFAVFAALLKEADVDLVKGDAQTALNEDGNFNGELASLQRNLPAALTPYVSSNEALFTLLGELSTAEKPSVTAAQFAEVVEQAQAASFSLWEASANELDALLETRINRIASHRNIALGICLAALVATGLLAWIYVRCNITTALNQIVEGLAESTEHLVHSAADISQSSHTLATGASEQAAAIEETSASLEEMSSMTKRNAQSTSAGKNLSQEARSAAAEGLDRLHEMSSNVDYIKGAVRDLQMAVSEMQSSSQEVAKIVKTIDEIAFQTNLLALNAAVEAARAGESGMGFAVVADEVRVLAQRSAQAAKDTASKIENAIKRSELGTEASANVVKSLAGVEDTARRVESSFQGIVARISSLDEVIGQVALASQEQSAGIGEVNSAMGEMDRATQANAASAEENASAAEELNGQAAALGGIVNRLREMVQGNDDAPSGRGETPVLNAKRSVTAAPSAAERELRFDNLTTSSTSRLDTGGLAIPMPGESGGHDGFTNF